MKGKRNSKKDIGRRRFELFMRDPLKDKMEILFRKGFSDSISYYEKTEMENLFEDLWIKANKKWNCYLNRTWDDEKVSDIASGAVNFVGYLSHDEINDPDTKSKFHACFRFSSGAYTVVDATQYIIKLRAKFKRELERPNSREADHFKRTGWIFYYLEGGLDDRDNVYIPVSPGSIPLIVDIGGLTEKDKTRVTDEIWDLIKCRIKERKGKGQRGLPANRDPKELGFITAIADDAFANYLRWYDLHMGGDFSTPKGLPFRTIAYYNFLEQEHPEIAEEGKRRIAERTKTIKTRNGKEKTLKGVIGEPIKGEDNVEQGVKLVYQAIHRKAYPSKKKLGLFNCPEHGRDCPIDCPNAKEWYKKFNLSKTNFKDLHTTDPSDIENFPDEKQPFNPDDI